MKKIILVILIALFTITTTTYAKDNSECNGRFGIAFAGINVIHKYVDLNCDGLWDIVLEFEQSQGVYNFTGEHWDCPNEYRSINITEMQFE